MVNGPKLSHIHTLLFFMLAVYKSILNGSLILLATMEQPGKDEIIFTEPKLIKEDLPLMSQCPQFMADRNRLYPRWNQIEDIRQ